MSSCLDPNQSSANVIMFLHKIDSLMILAGVLTKLSKKKEKTCLPPALQLFQVIETSASRICEYPAIFFFPYQTPIHRYFGNDKTSFTSLSDSSCPKSAFLHALCCLASFPYPFWTRGCRSVHLQWGLEPGSRLMFLHSSYAIEGVGVCKLVTALMLTQAELLSKNSSVRSPSSFVREL